MKMYNWVIGLVSLFSFAAVHAGDQTPANTPRDCLKVHAYDFQPGALVVRGAQTALLKAAGYCVVYVEASEKRAALLLANGGLDIIEPRIATFVGDTALAGIRIEDPAIVTFGYLVSYGRAIASLDAMNGEPLGIVESYKWHREFVADYPNVVLIPRADRALVMAKRGRIRAFLSPQSIAARLTAESADFYASRVASIKLYYIVAKNRRDLVPVLTQVSAAMAAQLPALLPDTP